MKTAYSYTRLSSSRQISGTGEQRQLARPKEICKQNGWQLSPKTFKDLGVSAFKGNNRLKGDLANFIQLAKEKKLGESPVLILEAFDRFSRQDIDASEPAILNLLSHGVDIFVAYSNKLFTKDSTKDLVSRIEILVSLKQAHDFSKNLSNRLKSANSIRKTNINGGKVMKIRHAPNYYSWDGQRYVQNKNSEIVKRIIREYLDGQTIYGISQRLNRDGIKTFGYKVGNWSRQVVKDMLVNPAIYGKFYDNDNFFSQPITDKHTFDKIQVLIARNSGNKGKFNSDFPNIFKGLCKCAYCHESMSMGVERYNSKSKKLRAEPYRYLRCSSVSNSKKCKNKHNMNLRDIEDEFFAMFFQKDPADLVAVKETDTEKKIVECQTQLNTVESKMSKLLDLDDGSGMDVIRVKLTQFKKQREDILGKLTELRNMNVERDIQKTNINNFVEIKKLLDSDPNTNVGDAELRVALAELRAKLKDVDFRNKIKTILPSFIKRIDFDTINWKWKVYDLVGECIYTSLPM